MTKIKWLIVLFLIPQFFVLAADTKCLSVTKSLYKGLRGIDVSELQTYLASDKEIYPEGLVTGYFGTFTEKAIQRFQEKHGIVSSGSAFTTGFGMVGPKTRAKIVEVCSPALIPVVSTPTPLPTPAPAPTEVPVSVSASVLTPSIQSEILTPSLDLKVNDSDGPVAVSSGSEIEILWSLSDHKWSWCNKLRDWSGSLPFPISSGAEKVNNVISPKTYKLTCYLGSQSFDDLVNVTIAAPAAQATASTTTTAAITPTFNPSAKASACEITATKKILYITKDALETTWETVYSTGLHFYWHDMIDGIDQGRVYGGKTNKKATVTYLSKPATYKRYYEIYQDPNHAPEYNSIFTAKLPEPDCKSEALTVEVKELP